MSVQGACADVRGYLSDTTRARLQWGLSAVNEGLEQLKRGQVEAGKITIEMGLRFLRGLLEEHQ